MFPVDQCHKLFDLFVERCKHITKGIDAEFEPEWVEYLNSLGCSCLGRKEVSHNFVSLMNTEMCLKGDVVCIPDPLSTLPAWGHREIDGSRSDSPSPTGGHCDFILVPLEIALKSLVLGGLP
jgi:hypothetical protein